MKILRLIDNNFEKFFLVVLLASMSCVIGVQVFMRYVLRSSLSWSEELARYLFIWMIYIGISYGVRLNRHIKVDAFVLLLSERWKKRIGMLSNLIFLGFACLIVYQSFGVRSMIRELGQESPAMGIPLEWVYTAVPAGFSLVIFRILQNLYCQVFDLEAQAKGDAVPEEAVS